jgi:hypothetical protein
LEIYRQEIVEAQRIVVWIALRELGYCEADMARYLGGYHILYLPVGVTRKKA